MINIPVSSSGSWISSPVDNLIGYFKSKQSLLQSNEELSVENKRLKIELLTLNSIREENDQLKEVLSYNSVPSERILAKVLNKPPFSPFDTFVIDKGDSDVTIGNTVYYRDVVIGTISETYTKTSVVRLNSSPNNEVSVVINNNEATALGQSNGTFEVMLPKDVDIEVGDVVLSFGDVIGVVEGIDINSSNTFQNLYFSYPFRLQDIDWVEVNKG